VKFTAVLIAFAACAQAQAPAKADPLHELSASIGTLAHRVGASVVQIFASGYALGEAGEMANVVTRQLATGSGVILSAGGYIVTNAHVVANARKVRVRIPSGQPPAHSILQPDGPLAEARIVGVDRDTDLAVVKVDAENLPFLAFGDSDNLRQGELVLAFGNPLGMEDSVSMGVVSSKARQIKTDDTMIYVQTDASINPGNSGGPLVDADGNVVGINTFILSQSGGSEGLGFAIPSNIVRSVYTQLRDHGHVHRSEIGVFAQSVTPQLAAALRLPQSWGVLLSDVAPDGPAADAGLQINDIVLALDGKPMENARQFDVDLYHYNEGEKVSLEVLRGDQKLKMAVPVVNQESDPLRFADMVDPVKSLVPKLGILAIQIDQKIAGMFSDLRKQFGLVVAARSGQPVYGGDALELGDVIDSVNGLPVTSVDALNQAIDKLKDTEPLVLQVQRNERLMYLTLEVE